MTVIFITILRVFCASVLHLSCRGSALHCRDLLVLFCLLCCTKKCCDCYALLYPPVLCSALLFCTFEIARSAICRCRSQNFPIGINVLWFSHVINQPAHVLIYLCMIACLIYGMFLFLSQWWVIASTSQTVRQDSRTCCLVCGCLRYCHSPCKTFRVVTVRNIWLIKIINDICCCTVLLTLYRASNYCKTLSP